MKKKSLSFLLVLALLMSFSLLAFADSPVNEARNGVVRIVEYFTVDGKVSDAYSGSAFFVGKEGENPRYLVTNYHMVEYFLENGKGDSYRFRDNWGNGHTGQYGLNVFFDSETYVEAYVVDYNENQDIAILKLEKPTEQRTSLPMEIPTESMVGDTVYSVGYPGVADDLMNPTSTWSVEDALISKGTVGRLVTESGSGTKWIQSSDLPLSGGNSGGPVLNEAGAVIGVAAKKAEDNTLYLAVNAEPVIEMLKKNAIEFDMAGDRAPAPEPAEEETPAPAEPEKSGSLSPVLIAVIAAVVAAVIIGLVLNGKKKKNAKIEPDPEEIGKTVAAARPAKKVQASVRSLAEQHKNQKVLVTATPITAGRSPDCAILFKDGTPGVSGRHCTIAWDAERGEFVVRDIGSTYGTFLDSGMQLEVNKPYYLKAGESFYLGEKANTLRLETE